MYEKYTREQRGSCYWGRNDYLEALNLLCALLHIPVPDFVIKGGSGGRYYCPRWPNSESGLLRIGQYAGYQTLLHELAHHVAWWRCYRRTRRIALANAIHHDKVFIRALRSVLNAADIDVKEYAKQAHYAIEKRMH